MAITVELRVAPDAFEAALSALAPHAWALEMFGAEIVLALFPGNDEGAAIARVQELVPQNQGVRASAGKVPGSWIGYRKELRATQIGPLWIRNELSPFWPHGQLELQLKTKDAFGTGLHETTLMCLERILELSPLERLLDVGTGTGILALAALRLGAKRAAGIDVDAHSLTVADHNARANHLADRFEPKSCAPDELGTFPVVVANIVGPILLELSAKIAAAVEPGGLLILSGVREQNVDQVADSFRAHGFRRGPLAQRGEWLRIELSRG
jgi:ribosomal protein L11 methyltransferase